jgi:hypothetical protein
MKKIISLFDLGIRHQNRFVRKKKKKIERKRERESKGERERE